MAEFSKIADLAVKDGIYEKDGRQYNRYSRVGCILSTPHGSRMFIKLNATAESDSRVLNIFPVEGAEIKVEHKEESKGVEPEF